MIHSLGSFVLLFLTALLIRAQAQSSDPNFVPGAVLKLNSFVHSGNGNLHSNVVFSPISISSGLAMLFEGMSPDVQSQVGGALGYPANHEEFVNQFKSSLGRVSSKAKSQVNVVVVASDESMRPAYANVVSNVFKAKPFRQHFDADPRKSIRDINAMVSKNTNGKIKNLMPSGSIKETTTLVLVNVLYFQSSWKKPFDSELQAGSFLTEQGAVNVDMMTADVDIGYIRTANGHQVISLPFEDDNFAMVIVLPDQGLSGFLQEEERSAPSESVLSEHVMRPDSLPTRTVQLEMPQFSVETRLDVKSILSKDPNYARFFDPATDYSRMTPGRVMVDDINHKAVISVTTGGVEAAAATGISVTLYSALNPNDVVKVDKPFLMYIVEIPTRTLLFSGHVSNPKAATNSD